MTNTLRRAASTLTAAALLALTLATATATAEDSGAGDSVTVTGSGLTVTKSVFGSNYVTNGTRITYEISLTPTDASSHTVDSISDIYPAGLTYQPGTTAVTVFTGPGQSQNLDLTPTVDATSRTVTFTDPALVLPAAGPGTAIRIQLSYLIAPDAYPVGADVDSGLTVDLDGTDPQTWNPIGTRFHVRSYAVDPCPTCVDFTYGSTTFAS
ncbi:hypothetical protein FCG67_02205 [Rhodococcus oryzae]|uniref:DUF11 domain-containing protein n=1 Tax=Rhodococcus oryzae TaxID=2571143 RepID=A0ABY2RQW5_9NOCA|nr:hypothetical protein [Rhodococcus oryzae]TJZ81458.1 hypothetical protein FCG67_02205 [Rhodococcus oryzae]